MAIRATRFLPKRFGEAADAKDTPRGSGAQIDRSHGSGSADQDRGLLHLGELIAPLRARLNIPLEVLTDDDILDSLKMITARSDVRARWLSAFNSPLGRWLILRGCDLNTELNQLIALLPTNRN